MTPEFLPGLDLYARRFFEQLFGLYAGPFVVVLDNLHEVAADAPLTGVLLGALLDSLPAHGQTAVPEPAKYADGVGASEHRTGISAASLGGFEPYRG